MAEFWDILDAEGNKTGRLAERGRERLAEGEYHLIVDVWVRNAAGQYLISHRTPDKRPDPDMWEPTCGSVIAGEDSLAGALREVREELGVELLPENGKRLRRVVTDWPSKCILDIWLFTQEADLAAVVFQPTETDGARWAGKEEILRMQADGEFIHAGRMPYIGELL